MVKNKKDAADKKDDEFPKKYAKLLPTGWSDSADAMESDELKKVIVTSRGLIADTEADMDNDPKLNVLKDDMKLLASAYKEAQNVEDAKIRYSLLLLRQRGQR